MERAQSGYYRDGLKLSRKVRRERCKTALEKTARRISATWFLEKEQARGFEACASIAECASPAAISAGLDAMEAWTGKAYLSQITAKNDCH